MKVCDPLSVGFCAVRAIGFSFIFSTCRYLAFLAPFVVEISFFFFFFKLMYILDAFAKDEVAIAVLVYFRVSVFIIIIFLILEIKHLTKTIQEKRA